MTNIKKQLKDELDVEMQKLKIYQNIIKGSLNKICSKNAKGGIKEVHQLTYKAASNITKTVYIKKEKVEETRTYIENHKKFKEIVEGIIQLNIKLLKAN